MTPTPGFSSVIVVGGGPAGLLLSILLASAARHVAGDGHCARHQPARGALRAARRVRAAAHSVIDDVRAAGFIPHTVCWRKLDGTYIAGLDGSVLDGTPDRLTCLPLDQLGKVLSEHLLRYQNAELRLGHKVVGLGEEGGKAWVDNEADGALRKGLL